MSWGNIVHNLQETTGTVMYDMEDNLGDIILEQLNGKFFVVGSYRNRYIR